MTANERHYFDLLMDLDVLLFHLHEVLDDHESCPGCNLCVDAGGMEYTVNLYYEVFLSEAPAVAVQRFKEETEYDDAVEEDCLALLSSSPAPANSTPVPSPELPSAKEKPYWIG